MLQQADRFSREYTMFPLGVGVLCAVSGGADSMCLLHWLSRQEGLSICAAHFNHQLRGEEADRDEAFVRDVCAQWHIPLTVGRGDVASFAQQEGLSIEEGARVLRYAFLEQAAEAEDCQVIATAHNAGDNTETLLLNLIRGTGLKGLGGIAPRRGKVVRPLLTTSRAEIGAYLAKHHIPHVEDSSNLKDDFLRNKIRHQLVPLLEEWNPGFVRRTTQAILWLREDESALEQLALQVVQTARHRGQDLVIGAGAIAGQPGPIAVRCVRMLLSKLNSDNTDYAAAHLEAVAALARSERPSGEIHLPHNLTVRREYDQLVFTPGGKPLPLSPFFPVRGENPVPETGWMVILRENPWPGLIIRSRQTGDRLSLDGTHTKTVKELFIDRKIPRWDRETIPLAADHDGVLAVAGLGPNLTHPKWDCVQFILPEKEER